MFKMKTKQIKKILVSLFFGTSLLFGKLKTGSTKIQNHESVTVLAHERLISNEEFSFMNQNDQQIILIKNNGQIIFLFHCLAAL